MGSEMCIRDRLQHATACYSMLQHATACYSMLQHATAGIQYSPRGGGSKRACCPVYHRIPWYMLQHATACYSMLQHATACYSMLQHATACYSVHGRSACRTRRSAWGRETLGTSQSPSPRPRRLELAIVKSYYCVHLLECAIYGGGE